MRAILTMAFILATASLVTPTYAQAPVRLIKDYTVLELVGYFASQYKVSETEMSETIKCESNMQSSFIGDHGNSFGVSQIYLPAHPEVIKEQAIDPVYSVEFMAFNFSKGKQNMWTCWRKLYGKNHH